MSKAKQYWGNLIRTPFKKMRLEDANDPRQYIGRTVLAAKPGQEPEEVTIKEILGNLKNQKQFQINGEYLVTMFSFFTQLLDGRLPTAEEEAEFELATDITDIKPLGKKNG